MGTWLLRSARFLREDSMPKLFQSVFFGAVLFTSASVADARRDAETLADAFLNVPDRKSVV